MFCPVSWANYCILYLQALWRADEVIQKSWNLFTAMHEEGDGMSYDYAHQHASFKVLEVEFSGNLTEVFALIMGYNFLFLGVQNKVLIGQELHRLVMCSSSKESTCFFSRASIFFFPCWCWSSYIFTIPSNKFDQWPVYKRIGTCNLWVKSIHDIGFLVTMGTFVKTLWKPCLNIVDISLSN